MKHKNTNLNTKNIEYYTPKSIVDSFGKFDYDPATTEKQALCLDIKNFDTKETDGLLSDWTQYKRIWCNPPFDKKHLFFSKAVETYNKVKNDIYFLVPIEFLTTIRFHKIRQSLGGGVKIIVPNGRIKFIPGFGQDKQTPAFGSVIITFQDKDEIGFMELEQTKYQGTLF